jgi:hypothetical protein
MNGPAASARLIEVPTLRTGDWLGVTLEAAELASTMLWVVTIRGGGRPTWRRWYHEEPAALAFAAEQSDANGLPLFDLRDGGSD